MNPKMTLVTIEANGHVLGVATRAGDPEGKLVPKDVTGEGLPIRNAQDGTVLLTVDPQYMKIETADFSDDILYGPLNYAFVNNQATLQTAPPSVAAPAQPLIATLDTAKLLVNTGSALGLNVGDKVWVQIENTSANFRRTYQDAAVADGADAKVQFNLNIPSGTYSVLLLVPGYRAVLLPSVSIT